MLKKFIVISFCVLILMLFITKIFYKENDETYNRRILGDAIEKIGAFATVTYGTQISK